jgi:hypothetical protein
MTSIRSRYFFPPRAWRRTSLRCNCATRRFNRFDPGFAVRSALPTHAEMYAMPELICGDIVAARRHNPQRIKKC